MSKSLNMSNGTLNQVVADGGVFAFFGNSCVGDVAVALYHTRPLDALLAPIIDIVRWYCKEMDDE